MFQQTLFSSLTISLWLVGFCLHCHLRKPAAGIISKKPQKQKNMKFKVNDRTATTTFSLISILLWSYSR